MNDLKEVRVHITRAPLVVDSVDGDTNGLGLLPAGTVLYLDQSYPERVTRYRVYVNIEGEPLRRDTLERDDMIVPLISRDGGGESVSRDDVLGLIERFGYRVSDPDHLIRVGTTPVRSSDRQIGRK